MKTFLIIFTAFFSLSAQAFNMASVHVGENATFNLTINNSSSTLYTMKMEVTAVDEASGKFTQTQTIYQGTTQLQQSTSVGDIADMEQYAAIVANCSSVGGTNETVTVPAGTFQTCHVVSSNENGTSDIQIANVPFGIAVLDQVNAKDGQEVKAELVSFLN